MFHGYPAAWLVSIGKTWPCPVVSKLCVDISRSAPLHRQLCVPAGEHTLSAECCLRNRRVVIPRHRDLVVILSTVQAAVPSSFSFGTRLRFFYIFLSCLSFLHPAFPRYHIVHPVPFLHFLLILTYSKPLRVCTSFGLSILLSFPFSPIYLHTAPLQCFFFHILPSCIPLQVPFCLSVCLPLAVSIPSLLSPCSPSLSPLPRYSPVCGAVIPRARFLFGRCSSVHCNYAVETYAVSPYLTFSGSDGPSPALNRSVGHYSTREWE